VQLKQKIISFVLKDSNMVDKFKMVTRHELAITQLISILVLSCPEIMNLTSKNDPYTSKIITVHVSNIKRGYIHSYSQKKIWERTVK
jgi:hypothetical protein